MSIQLTPLTDLTGFIGACLVDSETGMILALEGGGGQLDLELAAAGNTEVVRAKRRTMASLKMKDKIEDILISLHNQYHIIRLLETDERLFLYVALDRKVANLALARLEIRRLEASLRF